MRQIIIYLSFVVCFSLATAQQTKELTFDRLLELHDADSDGVISQLEFKGNRAIFNRVDINKDGLLSESEFLSTRQKMRRAQGSQQATGRDLKKTLDGVTIHRDLEYAVVDGESLQLDIYLPEETEAEPPLIVWIHGGGWRSGDKAQMNAAILRLSEEGYAVASINYRLDDAIIHPKNIHDCKGAVRWLRAHADEYGYDSDRIAVGGGSAGGHLALLLGLSEGVDDLEGLVGGHVDQSSAVNAIIDFYGPSDLVLLSEVSERFNRVHPTTKQVLKSASPLAYLSEQAPPVLIFHGDQDRVVPVGQSVLLHEQYQALGLYSEYHVLPGEGHGGRAFSDETRHEQVKAFLDLHL